jgi:Transposase C of IS166 homeodomain/zinc-finger binding domain of transposase IS66
LRICSTAGVPITPETLPDDPAALKRIIAAMAQDALTAQAEIARLKFQLARFRRAEFGRSSEKLARDIEQLEMALEALETDQAERLATASPAVAAAVETAAEAQKPARRPLPEHLPREDLRHPAPCTCPSCGGALRKISDEVTETLDYVPGRFKSLPPRRRGWSGTFARNCRAGFATQWLRHRRQTTRSPAGEPGRDYWLISSCRSTTIICRSIVRPRSSPATG